MFFATLALFIAALSMCKAAKRGDERIKGFSQAESSESSCQERGGVFPWIIFYATAVCASALSWWQFKRVCAWHKPKPIRIGGNPFAKKETHGVCPKCFDRLKSEMHKRNS